MLVNPYKPSIFLWDIGKQCKTRSDAAERGVWSGSPLFAYRSFFLNLNKNEKYHPKTLKTEKELARLITVGNSIGLNG